MYTLIVLPRCCRSRLRTAGVLALLAVVALSRACVAGVLSAAGVNYVLNSLIPVIERALHIPTLLGVPGAVDWQHGVAGRVGLVTRDS